MEREEDRALNKFNKFDLSFKVPSQLKMKDGELCRSFLKSFQSDKLLNQLRKYNAQEGKNKLILSHNDPDGHCSSACIYLMNDGTTTHKVYNIDGYSYDYSDILIQLKEANIIYITDLALKDEQLQYIIDNSSCPIIWIDHHESSLSSKIDQPDRIVKWIHSEIGISAACMCYCNIIFMNALLSSDYTILEIKRQWETILGLEDGKSLQVIVPNIVRLISEYDTFHDDMVIQFTYGLQTQNIDINTAEGLQFWKDTIGIGGINLSSELLSTIYNKGLIIEQYLEKDWERLRKNTLRETTILIKQTDTEEYFATLAIMNADVFSMAFGEYLEKCDGCIRYYQKPDGSYTYSIYSSKTRKTSIDCGKFAANFGGGGHKHAGGWTNGHNIMIQFLSNKSSVIKY